MNEDPKKSNDQPSVWPPADTTPELSADKPPETMPVAEAPALAVLQPSPVVVQPQVTPPQPAPSNVTASSSQGMAAPPAGEPLSPESAQPVPVTPAPAEPIRTELPTTLAEPTKRKVMPWIICLAVVLAVFAGLLYSAYYLGNKHGYSNGKHAESMAMTSAEIKVPTRATMIAQCAVGEGTQYVLPSDIPRGPIYNVWNNKITGVEYMLAQSEIASSKALDLMLMGQKYDHVDVMYEAAGHAGFTEPHYHVILSLIPYGEEQKITCGTAGAADSASMMH